MRDVPPDASAGRGGPGDRGSAGSVLIHRSSGTVGKEQPVADSGSIIQDLRFPECAIIGD